MKIKIDSKITKEFPKLLVGVVVAKNIDNRFKVSVTEQLLNGICAQIRKKLTPEDLEDMEVIQSWRKAFKSFGANEKKYFSSIEALLKRVTRGDEIPSINKLVDVYNYLSLKYKLPIGGEDLDQVCGDVVLEYAEGNEPFVKLGSKKVEYVPSGEIVYKDDAGVTCRKWNYRECDRTKFTEKTKNACVLMEDLGVLGHEEMKKLLLEAANFIKRYCGGEIETHILSIENPYIETGIEGQKNISDDPEEQLEKIVQAQKAAEKEKAKEADEESEKSNEKTTESETDDDKTEEKKVETPKKKAPITTATTWDYLIGKSMEKALNALYPEEELEVKIDYPRDKSHGDYSCNAAMILAKKIGMNPREVAEKIKNELGKVSGVEKVEIAGPGFLNFFLSNTSLGNEVNKIIGKKSDYGLSDAGRGKTVIVEYSSPNIAKPLAAHHLPTTVIGQVIKNLYEAVGFNAISMNHIGDWGTQFGKLISAYKKWGDKNEIESKGIQGLLDLYVTFHNEVKKEKEGKDEGYESELEASGRAEFKKLEDGDIENRKIWNWFIDITMKEVIPVYNRLGVRFDEVIGESFYEDKMGAVLRKGTEEEIFTEGERGALVVEFEEEHMPTCVVQKSDGATLYLTRDLATVNYRVERWHPEKIVYVVDVAQSLHFKQVFDVSTRLGYTKDTELVHVDFGRMSLPDGKMSTREGNVIFMSEVLNEAVERAEKVLMEKSPDLSRDEVKKIAEKVGIGAVKYNILSQNRNTNITFVWNKMLSFEGNSAPYLQYTTARAHSILAKKDDPVKLQEGLHNEPENSDEIELKRMLPKFGEVIRDAAINYKPNVLCNYLFELAKQFNAFYNNSRVLGMGAQTQERRIELVRAALQVLENGMKILSIEPLERM